MAWRQIAVVALAGALLWAGSAHAEVYKCIGTDGKASYSDKPCDGAAKPVHVRNDSFGGNGRNAEVSLQGTACVSSGSGRYAYANGMLVNNTKEAKTVIVRATFTRRGTVVDTASSTYSIRAFGRMAYSIIGGPGAIDRCSVDLEWD